MSVCLAAPVDADMNVFCTACARARATGPRALCWRHLFCDVANAVGVVLHGQGEVECAVNAHELVVSAQIASALSLGLAVHPLHTQLAEPVALAKVVAGAETGLEHAAVERIPQAFAER